MPEKSKILTDNKFSSLNNAPNDEYLMFKLCHSKTKQNKDWYNKFNSILNASNYYR